MSRVHATVDHAHAHVELVEVRGERHRDPWQHASARCGYGRAGGVNVVQVHFGPVLADNVEHPVAHIRYVEG